MPKPTSAAYKLSRVIYHLNRIKSILNENNSLNFKVIYDIDSIEQEVVDQIAKATKEDKICPLSNSPSPVETPNAS